MEGLAGGADHADGVARDHHDGGAGVRLLGEDAAELRALGGGGAHQGDLRVVKVELPAGELLRDRFLFAEVHHVEAAGRDHGGYPRGGGGVHAGGAGVEHAADQLVGPLGGGEVEHAGDHATFDQRFHRAAARAGGGEDQHLVAGFLQHALGLGDAGGGVAEHAGDDERPGLVGGDLRLDHPADGTGGAAEDHARQAVEAGDVGDAGHHDDVLGAEVVGHVAAGEGGDHQLGEAERQGAHRRGGDGRAAAAAERDHAVDPSFRGEPGEQDRRGLAHRGHAFAAVLAGQQGREVEPGGGGDFRAGDVGRDDRRVPAADVDQQRAVPALADQAGDERVLFALRVHGPQNSNGLHFLSTIYHPRSPQCFRFTGIALNSRVRAVSDCSTAMRSSDEAPTKPTASVCSLM